MRIMRGSSHRARRKALTVSSSHRSSARRHGVAAAFYAVWPRRAAEREGRIDFRVHRSFRTTGPISSMKHGPTVRTGRQLNVAPPRLAALPGAPLRPLETAQTQPNAPPSASARLSPSANNVYFLISPESAMAGAVRFVGAVFFTMARVLRLGRARCA